MPLVKIENKCNECNHPYILAVNPSDYQELSCCPFCGSPIDYTQEEKESDE